MESTPSCRKQLAGNILEGLELERIACGIEKEHRRLFAGLIFESGVGFDDELHALALHALGQCVPLRHLQDDTAMRDGNALSVDRVVVRGQRSGLAERGV